LRYSKAFIYEKFVENLIYFLGSIDDQLARDGLSDTIPEAEDIRPFANFYMFMSTLQGFMSIRHKEQGK
jgi:hypothetical protein